MQGKCAKCGQNQELAMYRKIAGGKRYFRPYCVPCWSLSRQEYQKSYRDRNADHLTQYHKEKYERTKEGQRLNRKRHYEKWKKVVFDHYGNACACCGETEQRFLTIDHIDDDGAEHRKEIAPGVVLFRWLVTNGFPKNFRILCFNCNSGRFHNGGECPHVVRKYEPSNWVV